jgi:hypothetical protein
MTQNEQEQGIRPYGPGKFSTKLDEYVWQVSLEGGADEEANVGGSWYGYMRGGHTIFRDHDPMLETLTEAERDKLTDSAGVIVREDSDGFVAVQYFDTIQHLERNWASIVAEAEQIDGE